MSGQSERKTHKGLSTDLSSLAFGLSQSPWPLALFHQGYAPFDMLDVSSEPEISKSVPRGFAVHSFSTWVSTKRLPHISSTSATGCDL